jgi:hypothetical protein
MLVRMKEWKSNTYNGTALVYDMTVHVLDAQKPMIGTSTINGRDDLGGDLMNPPSHAKSGDASGLSEKARGAAQQPAIARALQPSPLELVPAVPQCRSAALDSAVVRCREEPFCSARIMNT